MGAFFWSPDTFNNSGGGSGSPFPDGSESSPSITFGNDTDTGIYRQALDTIAFTTGGVTRMNINLGEINAIGSSTRFGLRDGSAALPSLGFVLDTNTGIYRVGADSLGFTNDGTQSGQILSNGLWEIGNAASASVNNYNSIRGRLQINNTGTPGAAGALLIYQTGGGADDGLTLWDQSNATYRQYVAPSGNAVFQRGSTAVGTISAAGAWTLGAPGSTAVHSMIGDEFILGDGTDRIRFVYGPGTNFLQFPNNDGAISSANDVYINIDNNDNSTDATFRVSKDGNGSGGTTIFQVNESGRTGINSSAQTTGSVYILQVGDTLDDGLTLFNTNGGTTYRQWLDSSGTLNFNRGTTTVGQITSTGEWTLGQANSSVDQTQTIRGNLLAFGNNANDCIVDLRGRGSRGAGMVLRRGGTTVARGYVFLTQTADQLSPSTAAGTLVIRNDAGIAMSADNGTTKNFEITSSGDFNLDISTATSATAGSNGDVPAQVEGYIVININGTDRKIPYYAT